MSNENKEITLSTGVKVTMRPPRVRDMRKHLSEPNPEEREILMIADICQMTMDELDELELKDLQTLTKEAQGFLA